MKVRVQANLISLVLYFQCHLCKTTQFVTMEDVCSISAVVVTPQESVHGPLLFAIYALSSLPPTQLDLARFTTHAYLVIMENRSI